MHVVDLYSGLGQVHISVCAAAITGIAWCYGECSVCWYFGVTVASAVIELHGRCYFKCGETILRSVLFLGHHQCMSSACVFSGFLLHRIYRCVLVLALLLVVSVFLPHWPAERVRCSDDRGCVDRPAIV